MKKFLTKLLIFILILLSYFGLNVPINKIMISRSDVPLKGINILIAGDSHPRRALDPRFFGSAENISQDAEPYFVTYWKLKYTIQRANIDTLILGFGHHNVAASFNDKKLSTKGWASRMFKIIYSLIDIRTIDDIEVAFGEYYKVYFQRMCLFPKKNHLCFFKEYSNSNRSNISNFDIVIQDHCYEYKEDEWISEISLSYLDSIINLCRDNKIELILVASPVHKEYYRRIPLPIIDRFDFEKNKLMEEGLLVIDLIDNLYPDDYYLNADHLNQKGASRFSAELLKIIKNHRDTKNRIQKPEDRIQNPNPTP